MLIIVVLTLDVLIFGLMRYLVNMSNHANDVLGLSRNSEEPGEKPILPYPVSDPATLFLNFIIGYTVGSDKIV